ncbi:hypothetical protein FDECE_13411 [Fusarium decemcellulare]|nr:hypothetical protein FDECE_13411 [Fusarium decemcellulare]
MTALDAAANRYLARGCLRNSIDEAKKNKSPFTGKGRRANEGAGTRNDRVRSGGPSLAHHIFLGRTSVGGYAAEQRWHALKAGNLLGNSRRITARTPPRGRKGDPRPASILAPPLARSTARLGPLVTLQAGQWRRAAVNLPLVHHECICIQLAMPDALPTAADMYGSRSGFAGSPGLSVFLLLLLLPLQ